LDINELTESEMFLFKLFIEKKFKILNLSNKNINLDITRD